MSETGSPGTPPAKIENALAPSRSPDPLTVACADLDQLSVSAWLPAAAFVFLLVLIGAVRRTGGDMPDAIDVITSMSWQSLVLLIGAVILATIVTQAFQFEAIRLLEGYWVPRGLRSALSDVLCRWHLWRRNRVRRRLKRVEERAFAHARREMLRVGLPRAVIDMFEDEVVGRPDSVEDASEEDLQVADAFAWEEYAPTRERRRMDGLTRALEQYPEADHLIRPTRLGNTLTAFEERALEERVDDPRAGTLEGFVQEFFDEMPLSLQIQHDEFRSRLDLYCTLVAVFVISGVIGVLAGVGAEHGARTMLVTAALTVVLTWLSYRAAIASARGYGSVLVTIAKRSASRSEAASLRSKEDGS